MGTRDPPQTDQKSRRSFCSPLLPLGAHYGLSTTQILRTSLHAHVCTETGTQNKNLARHWGIA